MILLGAAGLLLAAPSERRARGDDPPVAPAPPPPSNPPPAPPRPPPTPEERKRAADDAARADREFVARVNAAIDKGQAYLLASQRPEGTWTERKPATLEVDAYGAQALVLTALAKTGVKASHPKMALGLKVVNQMIIERKGQQKLVGMLPGHRTYAAACVAMLLDALYVEHPGHGVQKLKDSLTEDARDELKDIVTFFTKTQQRAIWRYPGPSNSPEDLSATQYALMGLITAGRVGIHAPPELYRRTMMRLLEWQEKKGDPNEDLVPLYLENPAWDPTDRYPRFVPTAKFQARGWSYQGNAASTGSMTCAGIACLAVIKDRLKDARLKPPQALSKEEEKQVDRAINGGLAWLSKSFTVLENPGAGKSWHYYYLYGMERAASLIGLHNIGAHDWYREAATYLLDQQSADGSWAVEKDVHVQTAFALLVLKRATIPTGYGPPPVTGGVDDGPVDGGDARPPGAGMDGR